GEEGEEEEAEEESDTEDSELSDGRVFDDQPGPSWRVMEPVTRRRRTTKKAAKGKKRKTTAKKATGEKTTKRKKKSPKKGAKRAPKRRRGNVEEAAEQRNRVRDVMPSLSLNGAGIDPYVSDGDREAEQPPVKRSRNPIEPNPPPITRSDPMDLLGQIMEDQTLALAPGRHVRQEGGRFVPAESFNRYIEKKEAKRNPQTPSPPDNSAATAAARPTPVAQQQRPTATQDMGAAAAAAAAKAATAVKTESSRGGQSSCVAAAGRLQCARPRASDATPAARAAETVAAAAARRPVYTMSREAREMEAFLNGSSRRPSVPSSSRTRPASPTRRPIAIGGVNALRGSSSTQIVPSSSLIPAMSSQSFSTPLPTVLRRPAITDTVAPRRSTPPTTVPSVPTVPREDRRETERAGQDQLVLRLTSGATAANSATTTRSPSENELRPVKKEEPESEEEIECLQFKDATGTATVVNGLSSAEIKKQMMSSRLRAVSAHITPILFKAKRDGRITSTETRMLTDRVMRAFPHGKIDEEAIKQKTKSELRRLLNKYVDDL
ncbi:hypothetical protein PFISCL1PPCAC_28175, partial [Pristionchus fissidentatus]